MTLERFAVLYWLLAAATLAWLLHLLDPVLTPFLAAGILAYICQPLVARMVRTKYFSRTWATLLVMSAFFGVATTLVLIMLPLLRHEFALLLENLPELLDLLRQRILPLLTQMGVDVQWDAAGFRNLLSEHWKSAGTLSSKLLPWLGSGSSALIALIMNLMLIPLVMFYLLRDWPQILARIDGLIPRRLHGKAREIVGEVDAVLAEFLRGQLIVMMLMSIFYAVALLLTGMQFALPIGIVSGMLVFVPYLGAILGLGLATMVAFGYFDSFSGVLLVWGIFAVGQTLESMVVTPNLVGDRIGLHPLGVIFALMAFGQLFGFFGVLLALPISAILLVGWRHFKDWYLASVLYSK